VAPIDTRVIKTNDVAKKRFVSGNREQFAWISPSGLLLFLWRKSFRGSLGQVIWFISKKDCFFSFYENTCHILPQ